MIFYLFNSTHICFFRKLVCFLEISAIEFFPLRFSDASSRSGLTDFSPHNNIYCQSMTLSPIHDFHTMRFNGTGRIARAESSGARAESIARALGRKVSLAKRSSLNFEILILTFHFSNFYVYKFDL